MDGVKDLVTKLNINGVILDCSGLEEGYYLILRWGYRRYTALLLRNFVHKICG